MLHKISLRQRARNIAIAGAVMLLLTSGVALAQVGTSGGSSLLGSPGVGPAGIPLGATEAGGGGLSPVPNPPMYGIVSPGSNASTGALGATELSNGGLSPMPSMPSSPPAPSGMGVPGMMSTGATPPYGMTAPGTAMPGTTGDMSSVGSAFSPIAPGSPAIGPGMQTQGLGTSIYGTGAIGSPLGPGNLP